jgi:hypothetical protein
VDGQLQEFVQVDGPFPAEVMLQTQDVIRTIDV